jgi:unspecific monooxygenase
MMGLAALRTARATRHDEPPELPKPTDSFPKRQDRSAGPFHAIRCLTEAMRGGTLSPMARVPGPRYSPALQTIHYLARPEAFLRGCHARYGDVFAIHTVIFGPEVCVVRPEAVKRVFTADPDKLRAGEANVALEPVVGKNSVLLLDGAEHVRQRRLMLPPFHGDRMRAYASTMRELTDRMIDSWPIGRELSLHPYMQKLTLGVILRTIFGLEDGSRNRALGDALAGLLDRLSQPISAVGTLPPFRKRLWGLSPWAGFLRAKARVDELIFAEIARRRQERGAGRTAGEDVLSMLLDARDEDGKGMTDVELRDELMTLLAAGHETTATELCWALDAILHAPAARRRLLQELEESGATAEVERLPYLDATIKEVLRLFPVVPAVGRAIREPMDVEGYHVPAGWMVVPSVWLTHRLPDVYPDPHAFRPERFLDNKTDPYAWIPFGGGSRRCLGMAFALFEMKIVLATVLSRVELRAASDRPARVVLRGFTHAPNGGARVIVERRRPPQRARDARSHGVDAPADSG